MSDNGNGMKDQMYADTKALYPGFGETPLFNANGSGNNPGVRLINNDDKLSEMLKLLWFPNTEMARNVAEALAECDEFLYNPDGKQNKEVLQRIEWIKNLCASLCSVNSRFADIYKQTAIGVATTAVTEKGATLVNMPFNVREQPSKPAPNNNNNGKKP